jgi:hypothetical protein
MTRTSRLILILAATAAVVAGGCGQAVPEAVDEPPAVVEPIDGSTVQRVTLTEEAAERIGIETAAVTAGDGGQTLVPTAAVLYDANGRTWVYTNPEGHVFVRAEIGVVKITVDGAVVSDGPPADTMVVTVGVAELLGSEYGVGDPE